MRLAAQHFSYFACFNNFRLYSEFTKIKASFAFIVNSLVGEFEDGFDVRAEVGIMQESIFFKTYIYKSRIEAGDQLFNFSQVQVAHAEVGIILFIMQLYQ